MTEEFVRYLEMCVNFHHENDESFKTTDSVYEKENLMYLKAIHYINELYNDVEKNHTNEQNEEENQIEGGVVSISDSVEKQYRPFNDCNELIEHYHKKYESAVGCDIYFSSLCKPYIWVRDKTENAKGDIELITGFTEQGNVLLNGTSYPLQHLFQMYEFLDGTPIGVEI